MKIFTEKKWQNFEKKIAEIIEKKDNEIDLIKSHFITLVEIWMDYIDYANEINEIQAQEMILNFKHQYGLL